MKPKISFVTPTFNRPDLLPEAVLSVVRQTMPHWELIIVDNGSQPPASQNAALPNDPRIRHLRFPQPIGVSAARNRGIESATAELIACLDDDDLLSPDYAETMLETFRCADPNLQMAWPILRHFTNGQTLGVTQNRPCLILYGRGTEASFRAINGIRATGTVYTKSALHQVGGFDETLTMSEDRDLMLRMLQSGSGCKNVDRELVMFRSHDAPRLSSNTSPTQTRSDQILLQRHLDFLRAHPALGVHLINMVARRQYNSGDRNGAIQTLRLALSVQPHHLKTWRRLIQWRLKSFFFDSR